jgi:nucleoside phosphorylase
VVQAAKEIARLIGELVYARIGSESFFFDAEDAHPGPPLPPVGETIPAAWPESFDVGILTVIGPELHAVQDHFKIHPQKDIRVINGSCYYSATVRSSLVNLSMSVVAYCMGTAGNDSSAAAAARLLDRWNPKVIFLLGIAAWRRGKCKIGDVVTPRVIVDDTLGVAQTSKRLKRPRIYPPPYEMIQQLQNFRLNREKWHERLLKLMSPPKAPRKMAKEYRTHVAQRPEQHEAALYSSNLLLRDKDVLEREGAETHQQIRIGEMEAAGFSRACQDRQPIVPWFVVRGVSDFGDEFKNDAVHAWAAHAAAAYLIGLIEDGIRVDLL